MSQVFVCGLGAVSPAGWGVAALRGALDNNVPLPVQALPRPGRPQPLRTRLVPPPPARPSFLAHPRLRRTSPLTHYAAAAALEALGSLGAREGLRPRLGVVACLQSGYVQYSFRFFEETLGDPATASPLVFPETVFAALASHLATLLSHEPVATTVVGDPAGFLQGLALAAAWLEEKRVELCLVLGAEESHWLLGDALWTFEHSAISGSGAGAVCLTQDPALSLGVELNAITDAHTFTSTFSRAKAAQAMRAQLPPGSATELLCDGLNGSPRADAAESAAWRDWPGPRLSPKRILGEGLMAAAAWQCVAACDGVARRQYRAANVSVAGPNQMALGARFERTEE